ncbi:hypothetical protein WJX75_002194 [Coccomyxa subellipsoidea]|uniref:Uncharacterized protein n=1 Tax=Coccomyxa subellipsoidea TaxID=248742 RepID=A0ABR2YV18_9CHLO
MTPNCGEDQSAAKQPFAHEAANAGSKETLESEMVPLNRGGPPEDFVSQTPSRAGDPARRLTQQAAKCRAADLLATPLLPARRVSCDPLA